MNIVVGSIESRRATISWLPPPVEDQNGPISHYNLFVYDLNFGYDVSGNTTGTSYTLTYLEEYSDYTVTIAAATQVGLGPYSSPVQFTTAEDSELVM